VTVERSEIGPNVNLEAGATVKDSKLSHTIVGQKSSVSGSTLHHSMLGQRVTVTGVKGQASLGDDCEMIGDR
jgi:glucose-1-phosphate thymidylyltransferase